MKDYSYLVNKPSPQEILHMDLVCKPSPDEIRHYGILGMHWGIRRYQNPDGTLTELGKRKYNKRLTKREKRIEKRVNKARIKEERKKQAIASNPEALAQNLDLFTNEEITRAYEKFQWKEKMYSLKIQKPSKLQKTKKTVDNVLAFGETANKGLEFLNSPIGRGLRGKMGLSTDKIFDFDDNPSKTAADRLKAQADVLKYKADILKYNNETSESYLKAQREYEQAKRNAEQAKWQYETKEYNSGRNPNKDKKKDD